MISETRWRSNSTVSSPDLAVVSTVAEPTGPPTDQCYIPMSAASSGTGSEPTGTPSSSAAWSRAMSNP